MKWRTSWLKSNRAPFTVICLFVPRLWTSSSGSRNSEQMKGLLMLGYNKQNKMMWSVRPMSESISILFFLWFKTSACETNMQFRPMGLEQRLALEARNSFAHIHTSIISAFVSSYCGVSVGIHHSMLHCLFAYIRTHWLCSFQRCFPASDSD